MIEGIKVITGSPEHVEKKLGEFLASHEKAAVLSSSVAPGKDDKAKPVVCVIAGLKF